MPRSKALIERCYTHWVIGRIRPVISSAIYNRISIFAEKSITRIGKIIILEKFHTEHGNIITIRQTGTVFSDCSRHASKMRHVARRDRNKNHKQKPEVTMMTTATKIITIVSFVFLLYILCIVAFRTDVTHATASRRAGNIK